MNVWMKFIILIILGGLIGYITNVIAVKLIFVPLEPIKIPIFKMEIVGLIPKRRKEIASNIAQVVQDELLSMDEILDNIITADDKEKIIEYVKVRMSVLVSEKLGLFPSSIRVLIENYIGELVEAEIRVAIDEIAQNMIKSASTRINVKNIVEEKINSFDLKELEDLIIKIAHKELRHIEILGLVLGLIIGVIQGIFILI
ncbi:MAG: DUF445 family protein [Clostridioides sp.]|jgi:uncharacterized membrane protein YheB (UPF0754 family)|nr:DUF445 family protein [Clostridioides sp.]